MKVTIGKLTYSVLWNHFRKSNHISRGKTTCTITLLDGSNERKVISSSETHCSLKDSYNKNTGRKISLKRALESGNFSYSERSLFWTKYYDMRNKRW